MGSSPTPGTNKQSTTDYNIQTKMIQNTNKFVFAKKDIHIPGTIFIEKNDVGIIESESVECASIFFIRIWQKVNLNKNDFKIFNVKKTGDGFHKKICNVCHKLINTSNFAKNQNAKDNRSVRRPSCQKCRKKLEGVNMSRTEKNKWLKIKPHNEPFECPICSKRTIAGVTSKVVLEHDHSSGKIRGWVCDSCNTGIGRFKDSKDLLERAIKFIDTKN